MEKQGLCKVWVATKAFVCHEGRVLVVRESSAYRDGTNTGAFDIVGGRMEPGEHFRDSLLREIKEETGIDVQIGRPFFVNEWRPTVRGELWQIVGTFFVAYAPSDRVVLSGDHDDYKWIEPHHYKNEGIIGNLFPAFEAYLSLEASWQTLQPLRETTASLAEPVLD